MRLFAPVPGIVFHFPKKQISLFCLLDIYGLWYVSSPGFGPYLSFRSIKTMYLWNGQQGMRFLIVGLRLWNSEHFPCLLCHLLTERVGSTPGKMCFLFTIQDRKRASERLLTAAYWEYRIPITAEKASLPRCTLFILLACAIQLYNCVNTGQALHKFSNV